MLTPPKIAEVCIEHSMIITAMTASIRVTSLWHISLAWAEERERGGESIVEVLL